MAYQFAHLQTYSRKGNKDGLSTSFVFDEVSREVPSACAHVANPEIPTIAYGMSIDELRALHDGQCAEATTTNVKGQTRAIRKDQNTLLTVILSYPGDDDPNIAPYDEWERRCLEWLKTEYGDEFKTAVRHTDEGFPHLHAYVLPDSLRANDLHPGLRAKKRALEADKKAEKGGGNKKGDLAYKADMRAWQDRFYVAVGRPCGMTRKGAGSTRKTHKEHMASKAEAAQARENELRAESLAREQHKLARDQQTLKRDRHALNRQQQALARDVSGSILGKMVQGQQLARLVADGMLETAREEGRKQGRREGVQEAKPQFDALKIKAEAVIDIHKNRAETAENDNAALRVMVSEHAAVEQDYEHRLALSEMLLGQVIEGMEQVAEVTRHPVAYRVLSQTTEQVVEANRQEPCFFNCIINGVKSVCERVRDRAAAMYDRFFGWHSGRELEPLEPSPAPAPAEREQERRSSLRTPGF